MVTGWVIFSWGAGHFRSWGVCSGTCPSFCSSFLSFGSFDVSAVCVGLKRDCSGARILLVDTRGSTGDGGDALWGDASGGVVMRGVAAVVCLEGDSCTSCGHGFGVRNGWVGHSGLASTGEMSGFDWMRSWGGDTVAVFDWPLVHWADAEDNAILSSCFVASKDPPDEEDLKGKVRVGGVRWDLAGEGTVMGADALCADTLWDGWVNGQRFNSGRGFFGVAGGELGGVCLWLKGCWGMLIWLWGLLRPLLFSFCFAKAWACAGAYRAGEKEGIRNKNQLDNLTLRDLCCTFWSLSVACPWVIHYTFNYTLLTIYIY